MAHASRRRVHCLVSGVVQGVCFRARLQYEASRLGLSGWARNLPDGRVEYEAEGEFEEIHELVDWSREGPVAARVDDVDVRDEGLTGGMTPFEIRPTPWS